MGLRRLGARDRGQRYVFQLASGRSSRKPVRIVRQVTCGTRSSAGTVKVSRKGRFSVRFAKPQPGEVAVYRVVAPLRGGATYSVFVAVRR